MGTDVGWNDIMKNRRATQTDGRLVRAVVTAGMVTAMLFGQTSCQRPAHKAAGQPARVPVTKDQSLAGITFFVWGEFPLRIGDHVVISFTDVQRHIRKHGGAISPELDGSVDYLVLGEPEITDLSPLLDPGSEDSIALRQSRYGRRRNKIIAQANDHNLMTIDVHTLFLRIDLDQEQDFYFDWYNQHQIWDIELESLGRSRKAAISIALQARHRIAAVEQRLDGKFDSTPDPLFAA